MDTLAKRFHPAILLALILLAAYFQASGIVALVSSRLLAVDVRAFSHAPAVSTRRASPARVKSAEPILARNPFDSETGPLNVQPIDPASLAATAQEVDLGNPLAAPHCKGVGVRIVTESLDPHWSVAIVRAPGEKSGRLRRVGDDVGDKKVAFIGYNRSENSPAVWLSDTRSLCQALLFGAPEAAPKRPAAKAPKKRARRAKKKKGRQRRAQPLPKNIANRIQKVGATEFNVDRSVVDTILENQAQLMRSARIVPEQKDGKVVGIRLFGIRKNTLLGKLGLRNGDRLEAINGFRMASPEKALQAYARLRTADNLNVQVTRRGRPLSLDYRIR